MKTTPEHDERIAKMSFASVYPHYVTKVERKGRTKEEQSCIWIEKGHFYGMGYLPADLGITALSEIKDYVTQYKSNSYIMQLIYDYVQKYPKKLKKEHFDLSEW